MTGTRPEVIGARHLARKAVVYVRQSSEEQVLRNQGSTEAQRNQEKLARAWGWRKDQIDVIDADLGLSGTATEHRLGYQRMVEEIRADRIGIVFVTDYSRAGRDSVEWFLLLRALEQHDVLLVIDGVAYDPKDAGTVLLSRVQAVFGEHENRMRRAHMDRGRMAKIMAGKTVTQPPVGYVRLPDGSWIRDPDTAVQQGVDAVKRSFLDGRDGRSLRAAVRILHAQGLRIPRRRAGHPVSWVAASVSGVQRIITNPNYTGDYVWGRTRSDARYGRDRRGRLRARRVEPARRVVIPDHHEPYVTRAEWDEIQAILAGNRWNGPHSGGLGRGGALLQGLIRCRLHRARRMAPVYKNKRKNGTSSHTYHCIGDHHEGGRQCGNRPGRPIDDAVVRALLLRLEPPALEILRAMWRQARRDALAGERLQGDERRRAERAVEDLWERYMSVDAERRLVRAELEQRLEDAKARVRMLHERGGRLVSPAAAFNEKSFQELLLLSTKLRVIWSAASTTDLDRKEILRTVIGGVYVDAHEPEHIEVTIVWADGAVSTKCQVVLSPLAHRLIREWAVQGYSVSMIAAQLTARGILTKYGTPWNARAVQKALDRMNANR